jgi:hypothetical protein
LQISEADRKLGVGTTMELEPLEDAIAERVGRSSQAVATIWLPVNVWDLDVTQWPAVPLARRLSLHGVGVRFCLPGIDVPMERDKRMRLLSLLQTTGADLVTAEPLAIYKPFRPLAHLSGEHGVLWATREEAAGEAADIPWRPGGNILRRAGIDAPIDDDRWGRMCAEHALPLSWERMDIRSFSARDESAWQTSSTSRSGSLAARLMRHP